MPVIKNIRHQGSSSSASTAMALPRSQQQQQQQQHAQVADAKKLSSTSSPSSSTSTSSLPLPPPPPPMFVYNTSNNNNNNSRHHHNHHHNHNQNGNNNHHNHSYHGASRGAKELGMLVMLLAAEAALLSSSSSSSTTAATSHSATSSNSRTTTPPLGSNINININAASGLLMLNQIAGVSPKGARMSSSASSTSENDDQGNPIYGNAGDESQSTTTMNIDSQEDSGNVSPSSTPLALTSPESCSSVKTIMAKLNVAQQHQGHHPFSSSEDEDEEEEIQQVLNKKKNSEEFVMTFLNTPYNNNIKEQQQQAQKQSATIAAAAVVAKTTQALLLNLVLGYLPWRDAALCRGTSKAWQFACASINCLFFRLPRTSCPAVFVYSQVQFDEAAEQRIEPRLQHRSTAGKWQCEACGFVNGDSRILCGSRTCQMPIATHRTAARLFAGQLRREGSVPYLRWLFEDIIGSDKHQVRIKNVENHRDSNTMRGKGCCWVYLQDLEMANPAVDMHHRLFSDVGPDGREGVWVVPEAHRQDLQDEIDNVSYSMDRPRALPRGALVVERPVMTPQMAPEKATISAKVAASHATIGPTTNSVALMHQNNPNANNAMLLQQHLLHQQQQHNYNSYHHNHHHHNYNNSENFFFSNNSNDHHLYSSSSYKEQQQQRMEFVQVAPVRLSSSQGKRYAYNPYAFVVQNNNKFRMKIIVTFQRQCNVK